ncbi:MAG: hypothetical protein IPL17_04385 [Anaerolineales bacterium]|nr:hypothetical protein [Anaerolineales bacterium]
MFLREFIAQKEFIFPPDLLHAVGRDNGISGAQKVPQWNTISTFSGYHIREAASTAAQNFVHSGGRTEYVRWGIARAWMATSRRLSSSQRAQ